MTHTKTHYEPIKAQKLHEIIRQEIAQGDRQSTDPVNCTICMAELYPDLPLVDLGMPVTPPTLIIFREWIGKKMRPGL